MRQSVKTNPTATIDYTVLADDLAQAMTQGYQLGFNADGSRLPRPRRAAKAAEYQAKAEAFLIKYQGNANAEVSRAYFKAIDEGKTHNQATKAASRRFRTLGMNAPVTNHMKTTYETAIYGAYMEGTFDASQDDSTIIGYRYLTMDDERVRNPEHMQFHGVTLPKSNPFWARYWPPICWNCRCRIQTLKRRPKGGWVLPPANPVPVCEGYEGQLFTLA